MKTLRICFINPPHFNSTPVKIDPPLHLLSLATYIQNDGYDSTIVDLVGESDYLNKIPAADIYGVSVYTPTLRAVEEILVRCKQINPACITVVGGIHVTALPNYRISNADIYIEGPGETAMLDLLQDYPYCSKRYKGKEVFNKMWSLNRNRINLDDYKRTVNGEKATAIQTSRGCPFSCAFCSEKVLHNKVRFLSTYSFGIEISDLRSKGYNNYFIHDDIFSLNKNRLKVILNTLHSPKTKFDFHARVGSTTPDDLISIKRTGGYTCRIGVESFSTRMLTAMNKETTREQSIEFVKQAKDAGLITRVFILFGFPGEDERSVDETISGIEECNPDQLTLATFVPYPGTDVYKRPFRYGVINLDKEFSHYNLSNENGLGDCTFETDTLPKERFLDQQAKVYNHIYSRQMRGAVPFYQTELMKRLHEN